MVLTVFILKIKCQCFTILYYRMKSGLYKEWKIKISKNTMIIILIK